MSEISNELGNGINPSTGNFDLESEEERLYGYQEEPVTFDEVMADPYLAEQYRRYESYKV